MLPERFNSTLLTFNTHQNLLAEVAMQLEKDFSFPDVFVNLDENTSLQQLYQLVLNTVTHFVRVNPEAVYAALYRVDLSEQKLRVQMESGRFQSFETVVSEMILERVIQKVFLRKGLL